MIEVKDVYFKYKDTQVLREINVNIEEGESIALIGPNGSGKSTFLKLINGVIFPTRGTYSFNGEEINSKKLDDSNFSKAFHKKVGFIFQNSDAQLFCSNVYEEIAFGPRQMGLDEEEVDRRVCDCLRLLDIEDLKYREPYNLSGGEKKRTAIACVLSMNPEVLVLDEPMNGIDPKGKNFLRELLIKLNLSGKTIICSTHDFQYVEGVFKRALVFSEEHSIVRDDSYDAVINDNDFLVKYNIK
ncbi:energy-coupling factor ABC transporter ATP-binding protein [Clostridium magnum]|uniref:Nickel import ATP-binding protein NikO n=1 Tax=Clostridium magnum DSM 2767 TaxID=1121326 RepID=A0A161YK15_9CLOT|nr:ABC transporter ATP-binding protein [Clostridium magnum]KZL90842.1 nickel import ATP-binding protein NikO [Clostridium magnum DSM 2767]SHI12098.1 cobalt/nickel transport system ATP-binding protein [Clostridium magnum DSM 2767]